MPPQSSDERQNVVVIDKHLTYAIISLVITLCLGIFFVWNGFKQRYKVEFYKQGTCILTEATVYASSGKQWQWMARWTVLLNISNSSLIPATFTESVGKTTKIKSTALAFIALRQVNATYPCFYDGQISPDSFNNDAEVVQWGEPKEEYVERSFYVGIGCILLSVLPSLYILRRARLKNCAKRRSDL